MKSVTLLGVSAGSIYLVLALGMAVWPGFALSATAPTPGAVELTAIEAHGRDAYVAEGCAYCHTQYVRPLAQDAVYGRPSAAGDYAHATPELFGTERNGPDLTNVGKRQPSDDWNYIHLYEPRALVTGSIMPSYRYLYDEKAAAAPGDVVVHVPAGYAPAGKVIVAGPEARALVAYIESLKQPDLKAKK
ncbi:MAG: cbb3-type cytochrome c oxidase subunit II [Candidatus Velthaea sp.]